MMVTGEVDLIPMGRTRSRPPDAMSRLVSGGVAAPWPWLYMKAEESESEADTARRVADAASDAGVPPDKTSSSLRPPRLENTVPPNLEGYAANLQPASASEEVTSFGRVEAAGGVLLTRGGGV
jgi:hypothetical protein